MQTLTANQIGLIRLAIINEIEESLNHDEYNEILETLESGCGVSILSCDEESQRLIDEVVTVPVNDHAWAPEAEETTFDDIPEVFLTTTEA